MSRIRCGTFGCRGHWADATPFLNGNLTADFLRLTTGEALVPIPEDTETVILKNRGREEPLPESRQPDRTNWREARAQISPLR